MFPPHSLTLEQSNSRSINENTPIINAMRTARFFPGYFIQKPARVLFPLCAAVLFVSPQLFAQSAVRPAARPAAAPAVSTKNLRAAATAEAEKPSQPIVFTIGSQAIEINDPFSSAPLDGSKWTIRGSEILRNKRMPGGALVLERKKLSDVIHIVWSDLPKQMEEASIASQRGDAAQALRIIQDVLNFFEKMKKDTPGSLWLKAANIKLEALMVLQNDVVLSNFIRELESVDSASVPGLADRIKLAKLAQIARRGDGNATIFAADEIIRTLTNIEVLAQAHIFKGNALLALRRPEDAMQAYLRINVFYGSAPKFIPAAQLGAARAFRAMNTPTNRDLKLDDVANQYLRDIIKQYPETREAQVAKTMLPPEEREAAAKAAEEAEKNVAAATNKENDPDDVAAAAEAAKAKAEAEAAKNAPAAAAPAGAEGTAAPAESAPAAEGGS
jgi:hypothetical protein